MLFFCNLCSKFSKLRKIDMCVYRRCCIGEEVWHYVDFCFDQIFFQKAILRIFDKNHCRFCRNCQFLSHFTNFGVFSFYNVSIWNQIWRGHSGLCHLRIRIFEKCVTLEILKNSLYTRFFRYSGLGIFWVQNNSFFRF